MADVNDNILFVPVMLDALVVGEAERDGFSALAPDFRSLAYWQLGALSMGQFLQTRRERTGIHLHWTLPDALLSGKEKDGALDFPALPNRWLIQRLSAAGGTIDCRAWILYSDQIIYEDSDIDPGSGRCYDVDSAVAIPTFVRDGKGWKGAGPDGELYGILGHCYPWSKRPAKPVRSYKKLDALGAGDPLFTVLYQRSRSVFGFYDNPGEDVNGPFTYVLSGWYDNPADDPLHEGRSDALGALGWTNRTNNQTTQTPNVTVCHAVVHGVRWEGKDPKNSYGSGAPYGNVAVYTGNNSAEAFSALLRRQTGSDAFLERSFTAAQYNLLSRLDDQNDPDAPIDFEQMLHTKQFTPVSGGSVWRIRGLEEGAQEVDLGKDTYRDIHTLRLLQERVDKNRHQAESLKTEAFFAWFMYVSLFYQTQTKDQNQNIPEHLMKAFARVCPPPPDGTPQEEGQLLDLAERSLSEIDALEADSKRCEEQIAALLPAIHAQLKKVKLTLEKTSAEPYFSANPPVLMFAGEGVARGFKQGFQTSGEGKLACRDSLLTAFTLSLPNGGTVASAAVDACMTPADGLPAFARALACEAALLSPDIAPLLAQLSGVSAESIPEIRTQQLALSGFSGICPEGFSIRPWKQPWSPVAMVWEIDLYPARTVTAPDDTFSQLLLGEIDFEPPRLPPSNLSPVTVQGYTQITPHAVIQARATIERMIKQYRESGKDYRALEAAAESISNMDVLSQMMTGLHEAFVLRDIMPFLPPYVETFDPRVTQQAMRVTETLANRLNAFQPSPRSSVLPQYFLPLRAGDMVLKRLRLVDAFGQYKSVNTDATNIHPAETVSPVPSGQRLSPRVMRPCRARFRWLCASGASESLREAVDLATTPVLGFVIPNFLEHCLQLFDADGGFLGLIQQSRDGVKWMGILNSDKELADIADEHLHAFTERLIGIPGALAGLLDAVDRRFCTTVPGGDPFLQLCFGRVLVLARAQLDLGLHGLPPHIPCTQPPSCNGLDEAKAPLRLGDLRKLSDGFVGFFPDVDGKTRYDRLFCVTGTESAYVVPDSTLHLPLGDGCASLTLLLDPTCELTLRFGFLPAQNVRLARELYDTALRRMDMLYRLAPSLQEPGLFTLPPPGGDKDGWSFTRVTAAGELETSEKILPPPSFPPSHTVALEGVMIYHHKEEETT